MMTGTPMWQGNAQFFDGETPYPMSVRLAVSPSDITLFRAGVETRCAVGEFNITEQQSADYVRIESKKFGKGVVMLNDKSGIAALESVGFYAPSRSFKTSFAQRAIVFFGTTGTLAALFFFFGIPALVDAGTSAVPKDVEITLGKTVFEEVTSKNKLASDSATMRVLSKCAAFIEEMSGKDAYKISLSIVEDRNIKNAFALPGGYIVIYRGILESMENESEFFGLLAHEAGHVYLRHGTRRLVRTAVLGITFSLLFGDVGGVSAVLLDNSQLLLNLSYDRDEELSSDKYAIELLDRAGLDPSALAGLLRRISTTGSALPPALLSSHPSTDERFELASRHKRAASKQILTLDEWHVLTNKTTASK
jgi:Zn-dependent protease with chaperone function